MIACQNDNVRIARLLVQAGASLTLTSPDTNRCALLHATLSGHAPTVTKYLLSLPGYLLAIDLHNHYRIDASVVDANHRNALYAEFRTASSQKLLPLLVQAGAKLDNKDINDETPLDAATYVKLSI